MEGTSDPLEQHNTKRHFQNPHTSHKHAHITNIKFLNGFFRNSNAEFSAIRRAVARRGIQRGYGSEFAWTDPPPTYIP